MSQLLDELLKEFDAGNMATVEMIIDELEKEFDK